MDFENSCCFTGHRHDKLGFAENISDPDYVQMHERMILAISKVVKNGCTHFYTGMATGFDIIAAEYIALIKQSNKNLRLTAVIPFSGQADRFPCDWKARYDALLSQCEETVILNSEYKKWAYDQRNRYMVDRCRYVIAYYNGSRGGTANTVKYATRNSREIINICETNLPVFQSRDANSKIISDPADK